MRTFLLVALAFVGTACSQSEPRMAKDAAPVFDVAAIRRTDPAEHSQGYSTRGERVVITNETVTSMIMFGYGVHPRQIVGAPAWLGSEPYNINGKPNVPGEPNSAQMQNMVRALLTERFGLKFHREKRELSYFALRVASGGPKMAKEADPTALEDDDGTGGPSGMTMTFTSNSMENFRLAMSYFVDRPLINETGLPGRFDFTLKWSPDSMKVGEPNEAPSLATALREQLGLKLESAKGPVEVLVIDAIERPSAN